MKVLTARNAGTWIIVLLFVILLVDSLVLTFFAHYSVLDAVAITGWMVGVISLALYLLDSFSFDPVFLRIAFSPTTVSPREFLIEATVSNEGGMRVHSCKVEVQRDGAEPILLNRVIVQGPRGAVAADPPNDKINEFSSFPRRPVQLRGYITAPDNTRVTIVIKTRTGEFSPVSFYLSP